MTIGKRSSTGSLRSTSKAPSSSAKPLTMPPPRSKPPCFARLTIRRWPLGELHEHVTAILFPRIGTSSCKAISGTSSKALPSTVTTRPKWASPKKSISKSFPAHITVACRTFQIKLRTQGENGDQYVRRNRCGFRHHRRLGCERTDRKRSQRSGPRGRPYDCSRAGLRRTRPDLGGQVSQLGQSRRAPRQTTRSARGLLRLRRIFQQVFRQRRRESLHEHWRHKILL